mgnify:CR=1 FL=1
MADEIEIGSKAIKQIQQLRDELLSADQALIKLSQNAIQAGKNIGGISTPGGLTKSGNDNAKISAELETLKSKYVSLSDTIVKKAEQSRLAEIQLQLAREKAFDDYSKKIAKQEQELNKKAVAEEKASQRAILAANKQAEAEAKKNISIEKSLSKLEQKQARENALAVKAASNYNRTQAQINRLTFAYNDLSVRKERYNNLSANEEMRLQTLSRVTEKYNGILKQTDATIGKNQRNVGNYASGYNALGNSISQLTSAIGITTGIAGVVALGTNIFNTTKEIISLDNALKLVTETQANFEAQQSFLIKTSEDFGVEIGSLTKQFTQFYVSAKDKLSGNEIQDIFRSITKAGSAMGLSTQDQERAFLALNQMMSKGTIQAEELRGQLGEALPGALGIMAKAVGVNESELAKMMKAGQLLSADVLPKFAKQLEITYGIDNVNRIDNLSSAQTRLSNSWTNFVRSLDEDGNTLSKFFTKILGTLSEIVKGTTLIFQSETTKQQNTFKHLREKGYNETLQYYNSLDELNKNDLKVNKDYMSQKILDAKKEVDILKGRNLILKSLQRDTPLGKVETTENKNERIANEAKIKDLANVTSSYLGQITAINSLLEPEKKHVAITKEGNKEKEKKVKVTKLETVNQLELSKAEDTALERLKQLKKALEQTRDETSKNSTEFQQFETSIKAVNESIDFITKGIGPIKLDIKTPFVEGKKAVEELKKATQEWLGSFSSEFLQNSGFGSLETFFDGTFDKLLEGAETTEEKFAVTFNAIAESAQEAFNFISNISQQNFDNENARLQSQYETALKFSGGSAVAEAKLAEDLEKKKKEISIREAKAKQKQAIFNIAIDTAQAIMATVGKTGFAGLPLALTLGALGAAQIALVASQKIPQYWMGGTHDGGLMMVNDGAGSNFRETIVTPDGNIHKPQGKNVIMNAPAGTEIFTHDQWNDQMNNMLKGNGINWNNAQYQQSNITKEDMKSAMMEAIGSQTQYHSNFDANGATNYILKNGNKTKSSSNRGNSIKQRFT